MSDFADLERDKLLDIAEASAIEIPRLRAINAELLKALERIVTDWGDGCDPTDVDCQTVFADARAAIAKAKGE